jgi:hypothetical protein
VSRFSRKCGSLDVSQLCGTPRPRTGIALFFHGRNDNNDGGEHLRVFKSFKMNCLIECQLELCTGVAEASGLLTSIKSTDHFKDVLGRSENILKRIYKFEEGYWIELS